MYQKGDIVVHRPFYRESCKIYSVNRIGSEYYFGLESMEGFQYIGNYHESELDYYKPIIKPNYLINKI